MTKNFLDDIKKSERFSQKRRKMTSIAQQTTALQWFLMVLENLSGRVFEEAKKAKNRDAINIFLELSLKISRHHSNPFHGDMNILSTEKTKEYKDFESQIFLWNCDKDFCMLKKFHPLLVKLAYLLFQSCSNNEKNKWTKRLFESFVDVYHLNCKKGAEEILKINNNLVERQEIINRLAAKYIKSCMKRRNDAKISIATVESAIWLVGKSSMTQEEKVKATKRLLSIKLGCGQETFTKYSKFPKVRELTSIAYSL